MKMLIVKYLLTAGIVVLVSEVARRSDKLGALIASLPLVTFMVMIWLYVEKQPTEKIGEHAYYTFWYVLPTLPMFLLLPKLLARGIHFWMALLICVVVTGVCFWLTGLGVRRFGINLFP